MERIHLKLSFSEITIQKEKIGEDILIQLAGGEKPHIGCVVLAVPRLSLTGSGEISCTSSVINLPGHKDEDICRIVAETICRTENCTVVCTGGFHVDHMSWDQIQEVYETVKQWACCCCQ